MNTHRYFDHAATTPIDPRVLEAMLPYLQDGFGNAHSIHSYGMRAMAAVEKARQQVAEAIGADFPEQIVFTSGSTEACNWVIQGYDVGFISPWEHSAVREPALARGFTVLNATDLELDLIEDHYTGSLICKMWVNNEIGTVWNPLVNTMVGDHIFSDATQALGKVPLDVGGLDFLAISAHKVYGPKGVGAMYIGPPAPPPLLRGGEQEMGARAGTLNVPGIVGFGAACEIAAERQEEDYQHATELRSVLLEELQDISDWQVNGERLHDPESVVPHILSLSFLEIEGETLVIEADQAGFAISAGAACSSRSTEPSHVLLALGLPEERRRGTVRISFGRGNTPESTRDLGRTLRHAVKKLRTMT